MMRRLFGPIGGPVTFFLVAALVLVGLGWVTVAALGVERAQREAAAQAELGNNLRVALWRLDGRMLPALGIEDSRPFYHYASADPLSGSTAGPTPLLAAPLPDWMKLHVQLDPATGWESPQVLSPAACDRVSQAWSDLPLRNNTADRAGMLAMLREKYPPRMTCELLAAQERSAPIDLPFDDSPPDPSSPSAGANGPPASAAKSPPPPGMEPVAVPPEKTSEDFRLFGVEFPQRDKVAGNLRKYDRQQDDPSLEEKKNIQDAPPNPAAPPPQPMPLNPPAQQSPPAPATQQQQMFSKAPAFPPNSPSGNAGRAGSPPSGDNERQWREFFNRAATGQRARMDAKNAGQEYLPYGKSYNYLQNATNPPVQAADGKNQSGNSTALPMTANPAPGVAFASDKGDKAADKLGKDSDKEKDKAALADPSPDVFFHNLKKAEKAKQAVDEQLKKLRSEQAPGTLQKELKELVRDLDRRRCLDEIQQWPDGRTELFAEVNSGTPLLDAASSVALAAAAGRGPRPVPPAEERPLANPQNPTQNATNNSLNNALNNPLGNTFNTLAGPPTVNIHLGSMRPHWVVASDGTETLMLVRAANVDGKTVFQAVVLDWPKLEQLLKDEVKDLFPAARLVPVRDSAGVAPDRTMTALPVQLDPGPMPPPPPAGWTPLRLGLVLAWVAALVAFAAVGLSGWSLIDLAERRFRFVSAVTHELRTPLTSLRLYLDLLMSGMIHDEAKRQEYLNTLATESDRLHRLIDNVLDFARLEKRAKNGDMKPVRVGVLLEQLQNTWADRVGADGKELVVMSMLSPETEVVTDVAMVQQVVGNLIDNARKYTRDAEDKRIWLWAKPVGNGRVAFEVEDRGCGVPPGERKAIFKPFRRGAQADTKAGGAGLGLALAKQWAEVLGGTLSYRPAEGAPGACFRLELPGK